MGGADSLGPLTFAGPFLVKKDKRLYPVPLALLHAKVLKQASMVDRLTSLMPSSVVTTTDLGTVRLPKMRNPLAGAKPLDGAWMTAKGYTAFLEGDLPDYGEVIRPAQLYGGEERLGIGRNQATRTTGDGLLYQTNHVRPMDDVGVGIVVRGLDSSAVANQGITRLGAEGRLASWKYEPGPDLPTVKIKGKQVVLVLLTHALFTQGWLPDGFHKQTLVNGQTVWDGELHGVRLRLISSVLGKPVREGGWDLVNRAPRPVDSLVPAGSCYYCEVTGGSDANNLHGKQIGQDTPYGRGEVAVGNW
jgi:CRISPR-associated protein Cmr3